MADFTGSGSDDDFLEDLINVRQSEFMMLTLEERVFKIRAYLRQQTYPFYNMSRSHKRNFRRIVKIHRLDPDDNYTVQRKVTIVRKRLCGKKIKNVNLCIYIIQYNQRNETTGKW